MEYQSVTKAFLSIILLFLKGTISKKEKNKTLAPNRVIEALYHRLNPKRDPNQRHNNKLMGEI